MQNDPDLRLPAHLTADSREEIDERYQAMFDRSFDLVYIHDFEGNFKDANNMALSVFGYRKEDLRSLNLNSLLAADQIPKAREHIQKALCGASNDPVEYQAKHKNGEQIDIETKISVIYHHGQPCAIIGIARDISKRKQMEERIKESERRFRDLADLLPVVVFEADLTGRLTYVNNVAFKMSGYSREELLGVSIFDCIAPEDRARRRLQHRPGVKRGVFRE